MGSLHNLKHSGGMAMLRHHHSLFETPPTPTHCPHAVCTAHRPKVTWDSLQRAQEAFTVKEKDGGRSKRGETKWLQHWPWFRQKEEQHSPTISFQLLPRKLPSPDCGTLSIVFDTKFIYICMYIYVYTYVYVYIYKHIEATAPFPWGNSVNTSHMVHGRAKEKKENKKYIGRDIYLFSLKLAFDMMIFYCRLREGREASVEFIFKFTPCFGESFLLPVR